MSEKLTIGNEMRQFDNKNRDFYDELTPEEKKKFSTFLMIRWGSAVEGNEDLQAYYLRQTNIRLNKHFFDIGKHPKLQWLCATSVSPDMGAMRHNWISPKKKEPGASTIKKQLSEIYPHYNNDEINIMASMTTQKDLNEYYRSRGDTDKK